MTEETGKSDPTGKAEKSPPQPEVDGLAKANAAQSQHPEVLHAFHPVARLRKPRRRFPVFGILATAATIAFFVAALGALAVLPSYLIGSSPDLSPADRVRVTNDIRGFLLQAIGGVALLIGLVLTWRTLRLNRETHLTDRFSAAVTQLDATTATARTGAILALERIARDSPNDRPMVVTTLATYIRERRAIDELSTAPDRVPPDVQAAVEVLGRRPGARQEEMRLDLSHCDLSGCFLDFSNWRDANFVYSRLIDSWFTQADIRNAALAFAEILEVGFVGANAVGASFARSRVKGYFTGADLRNVDFHRSDLTGSSFERQSRDRGGPESPGPKLQGANFESAKLTNVVFRGTDLSKVKGLASDQLADAILDDETKLPRGVSRPK